MKRWLSTQLRRLANRLEPAAPLAFAPVATEPPPVLTESTLTPAEVQRCADEILLRRALSTVLCPDAPPARA